MRLSTIDKLCCPFDKADLELTIISQDINENILEGFLSCTQCKRVYPFVKGVPIMNPDEYREAALEKPLFEEWGQQLQGKEVRQFRLVEKN